MKTPKRNRLTARQTLARRLRHAVDFADSDD